MNKNRLNQIINECVDKCLKKHLDKMSLNETHCVRVWHYTSFDQALSIIKSNKFKLRQNDDAADEGKCKHKGVWYDEYGKITTPPKYMLCATRIRDSRVGFSSSFQYGFITDGWGFARFELDENAIEVSPQLTVRTEKDSVNQYPHINDFNTKKWNFKDKRFGYYSANWENQHEERILSKTPVIDNASQYIKRIDFLIKDKTELETLKVILKKKRIYTNKVFVYTNMNDFNAANDNFVNFSKTSLNESNVLLNISYNIDNDIITFYNNNERIGGLCFNVSNYDDIYSEYHDSVEDFDDSIMRKFNFNNRIVNIEDIWINRNFQSKGLFRKVLTIGLNLLSQKYNQFILRACSDNGFPNEKLISIYKSFGFIPYQETEQDGTIMFMTTTS